MNKNYVLHWIQQHDGNKGKLVVRVNCEISRLWFLLLIPNHVSNHSVKVLFLHPFVLPRLESSEQNRAHFWFYPSNWRKLYKEKSLRNNFRVILLKSLKIWSFTHHLTHSKASMTLSKVFGDISAKLYWWNPYHLPIRKNLKTRLLKIWFVHYGCHGCLVDTILFSVHSRVWQWVSYPWIFLCDQN